MGRYRPLEEFKDQPLDKFARKFKSFYEYVGKVSLLDKAEVKRFALSHGRLQLHTKEDFDRLRNTLIFLVSDSEFTIPEELKKELLIK